MLEVAEGMRARLLKDRRENLAVIDIMLRSHASSRFTMIGTAMCVYE